MRNLIENRAAINISPLYGDDSFWNLQNIQRTTLEARPLTFFLHGANLNL